MAEKDPTQPVEDVEFDEDTDPDIDESRADYDAEETNAKEVAE